MKWRYREKRHLKQKSKPFDWYGFMTYKSGWRLLHDLYAKEDRKFIETLDEIVKQDEMEKKEELHNSKFVYKNLDKLIITTEYSNKSSRSMSYTTTSWANTTYTFNIPTSTYEWSPFLYESE